MPRKNNALRVIDLEVGMPRVEEARLRMQHELHVAREQGCKAVKLVHGYGSSGVGGRLRDELQKDLFRLAHEGSVHAIITGENWRISDETTWEWLKRFPEWKQDSDLGRGNKGISIVVL
ncbi:MAG TPA: Smr/MutS family protein [Candidatus Angelobacter sp.]|nr:Smr/MutS family protein [Candidatus Angelobacter sp.]